RDRSGRCVRRSAGLSAVACRRRRIVAVPPLSPSFPCRRPSLVAVLPLSPQSPRSDHGGDTVWQVKASFPTTGASFDASEDRRWVLAFLWVNVGSALRRFCHSSRWPMLRLRWVSAVEPPTSSVSYVPKRYVPTYYMSGIRPFIFGSHPG